MFKACGRRIAGDFVRDSRAGKTMSDREPIVGQSRELR